MIVGELRGEKVLLRSLEKADVKQPYLRWLNDREVNKFLEIRFAPPASIDELEAFVNRMNESPNELLLGIFTAEQQQHIGNIKLGPIVFSHLRAVIGIVIGEKDFWGKGLATEAIELLSNYAVTTLGLKRIYAGCYESNVGSRKAFEKAGFTVEAKLMDFWENDDGVGENELILRKKTLG